MADEIQKANSSSSEEAYETLDTEISANGPTRDGGEATDNEEEDPDPQNPSVYSYNSGVGSLTFRELGSMIEKHLNASDAQINKEPPFNEIPTRQEYNKQQRLIWQDLRAKVAADDSIPTAIFEPPRSYVQVRFAEWPRAGHYCCPCDLDEKLLDFVELRAERGSEHGITKDLVLQQVAKALYGGEDGSGWTVGDENSRPVLDHFSWMSSGGALLGHIFAMMRGLVERESL